MDFKLLQELVDDLNSSNSSTHKKLVMSNPKYNTDFIQKALLATYHPFKKYNVTSENLKKNKELCLPQGFDFFELLEKLHTRELSGHDAIFAVNGFILEHIVYQDLIHNIIDRNLKTRASEKMINEVFIDLVPVFNLALAYKYEKHMHKVKFNIDIWYASRKFDGVRCVVIIDENGDIKIKSREGNRFYTLSKLEKEFKKLNLRSTVFDGEICIVDENGVEQFADIMELIKKKNFTIERPKYYIFDMLTLEEFEAEEGDTMLADRYINLEHAIPLNNEYLTVAEQVIVRDEAHLEQLRSEATDKGWEGVMIRLNMGYKGKKSRYLLKCKAFFDAEYIVQDIELSIQRIIIKDENGVTGEGEELLLKHAIIEHKSFRVDVGSGWSLVQKRYYRDHPEELIGKQITVQYQEETKNKKGTISLRFPTVKHIYNDGDRDV